MGEQETLGLFPLNFLTDVQIAITAAFEAAEPGQMTVNEGEFDGMPCTLHASLTPCTRYVLAMCRNGRSPALA